MGGSHDQHLAQGPAAGHRCQAAMQCLCGLRDASCEMPQEAAGEPKGNRAKGVAVVGGKDGQSDGQNDG